jgi:hypothetical protein
MKTTNNKNRIPITERALIQRVNRALVREDGPIGRKLIKTRGERAKLDLGDYFVLNQLHNFVDEKDVDPESLARELGALADYEYLFEEAGN